MDAAFDEIDSLYDPLLSTDLESSNNDNLQSDNNNNNNDNSAEEIKLKNLSHTILPIHNETVKQDLLNALENFSVIILVGETGCGYVN